MPAPKRPNTSAATRAATAKRVRAGLETMAAKLKAAGYDFRPPPECPRDKAFLIQGDGPNGAYYVCPVDSATFDFDAMEEGRDWR